VPIQKKRELSEVSNRILNSVLFLTGVHYYSMNTKESKQKGLSEIRFGLMIFFFRMAGIPLKMKKVSTIYAVYMTTVALCYCSMFIGMIFDVYIHWGDLGRAMTTVRVLFPLVNVMWIFSYCR
jgi:hypothetical protein